MTLQKLAVAEEWLVRFLTFQTLGGYSVVSLGWGVINDKQAKRITEINVPDSVERIGAILSCKNLNYSGLITDREELISEMFLQNCGIDYTGE